MSGQACTADTVVVLDDWRHRLLCALGWVLGVIVGSFLMLLGAALLAPTAASAAPLAAPAAGGRGSSPERGGNSGTNTSQSHTSGSSNSGSGSSGSGDSGSE